MRFVFPRVFHSYAISWISDVCLDLDSKDRTGKYSTKLTAKRRYVPRIAKGAEVRCCVCNSIGMQ